MTATVLYISIIGTPDKYDPADFADLPDSGDDGRWVRNRLDEWGVLDQLGFRVVYVTQGETLPELDGIDAVIVGGSVHSVNENQPWQRDVFAWLARWRSTGRPALGICGGHQMMSVMGGVVVAPRANGAMCASGPIDFTPAGRSHALFDGFDAAPWFHSGNTDHVVAAPAGSVVLATVADSPAMALDHGGGWLSVQFHPEARHDVSARHWLHSAPHNMANYSALPQAPRVLVNFLRLGGLID